MKYQPIFVFLLLKSVARKTRSQSGQFNLNNHGTFDLESLECHLNIDKLMNFLYGNQCVQIVSDGNERSSVNCVAIIMKQSENVTIYTRSINWMMKRNIYTEEIVSQSPQDVTTRFCENYLIFAENITSLSSMVTTMDPKETTKNFFPFSKVYFLIRDLSDSSYELKKLSNTFRNRSLFGYIFEFDPLTKTFDGLRDLLTLNYTDTANYAKTNLIHPFVDRNNTDKVFRISFHECFPYVIYADEKNLRFDGTEYRLVEEVIKNWKVEYLFRDWSKTQISPYVTMYQDLLNHSADIAMCAVWLSDHGYQYDLTTFHSHECHSMLVPKPKKLNEATAIYTTLSVPVWILFGFWFIMTGLFLWGIGRTKILTKNRYVSLIRTFLDITNVATSHGLETFPDQNSVKILLLSWILLSFWIGISYSTIYTSRLTSPGFTKLIDTLEDFLSSGLYWGTYFLYPDIGASLQLSANPHYQELYRGIQTFKDRNDADVRLKSGKCCVLGGISRNKYLISYDWSKELHLFTTFRLMKRVCILNYYSIFPLQKFSPYTDLFSEHALRYQEHGFSEYWYSVIYREKHWYETFFEDYPQADNEPKALTTSSIVGALMVLFLSSTISIVVFVLEVLYKSNNNKIKITTPISTAKKVSKY